VTHDPFPVFEYLTQTQLGEIFGTTSHQVGRWLKELGLRTVNNQPSPTAIKGGLVQQVTMADGVCTFTTWHKEKTVALLERAGLREDEFSSGRKRRGVARYSWRRTN
jgi:hypothetical protein